MVAWTLEFFTEHGGPGTSTVARLLPLAPLAMVAHRLPHRNIGHARPLPCIGQVNSRLSSTDTRYSLACHFVRHTAPEPRACPFGRRFGKTPTGPEVIFRTEFQQ